MDISLPNSSKPVSSISGIAINSAKVNSTPLTPFLQAAASNLEGQWNEIKVPDFGEIVTDVSGEVVVQLGAGVDNAIKTVDRIIVCKDVDISVDTNQCMHVERVNA